MWIEAKYERLDRVYLSYGCVGHGIGRCNKSHTQIDISVEAQMDWIHRNFNTDIGLIPTRIHFVLDAARFTNNSSRRTIDIYMEDTPRGMDYRPWHAPLMDLSFDPCGVLDEQGNMQPFEMEVDSPQQNQGNHTTTS